MGGVPAYSTLGWFDDPVLNTFVNYPDYEIARLIFHEFAHQTAFAKNDTEFNESFAVTVEIEGARRWIAAHGDEKMKADFERTQQIRGQFTDLVLKYRAELAALYKSKLPPPAMRERKAAIFSSRKDEYGELKAQWGYFSGHDRFFANPNNASLASIAIYNALVPQFQAMIARHNGDMAAFYDEVKELTPLSKEERATIFGTKP